MVSMTLTLGVCLLGALTVEATILGQPSSPLSVLPSSVPLKYMLDLYRHVASQSHVKENEIRTIFPLTNGQGQTSSDSATLRYQLPDLPSNNNGLTEEISLHLHQIRRIPLRAKFRLQISLTGRRNETLLIPLLPILGSGGAWQSYDLRNMSLLEDTEEKRIVEVTLLHHKRRKRTLRNQGRNLEFWKPISPRALKKFWDVKKSFMFYHAVHDSRNSEASLKSIVETIGAKATAEMMNGVEKESKKQERNLLRNKRAIRNEMSKGDSGTENELMSLSSLEEEQTPDAPFEARHRGGGGRGVLPGGYYDGGNRVKRTNSRRKKWRRKKSKVLPRTWQTSKRLKYNSANVHQRRLGPSSCQLHEIEIDFADLGWDSWMIQPRTLKTAYCGGQCQFPVPESLHPTNQANFQSLLHVLGPSKRNSTSRSGGLGDIPAPSCVPVELTSATLLYFEKSGEVVLRTFPELIPVSCGCR